ncbi:MAG TPA: ATP-binding cassette domain-containing protein [Nitrospiria bacterium]|nr:ATP-binding cassette domain-containing protein [Nitrospiria bacterium]
MVDVTEEMIAFEQVTCSYENQLVLKEVSFRVSPRETKVIIGASGSGKTTILRLILGLLKPVSGRIFIEGQEISEINEQELIALRRKIGMVFQEGALFDSMTVGENVGYRLFEEGELSDPEIEDRVRHLLGFVGLEEAIDMMPDELSGGMRRRVAIMRALAAVDARMMLYDEPTTGLDPMTARTICDLIRRLRDVQGVTSVMVTHQMADAFRVGDRFLAIHEGAVVFEGTADELRQCKDEHVRGFLV